MGLPVGLSLQCNRFELCFQPFCDRLLKPLGGGLPSNTHHGVHYWPLLQRAMTNRRLHDGDCNFEYGIVPRPEIAYISACDALRTRHPDTDAALCLPGIFGPWAW